MQAIGAAKKLQVFPYGKIAVESEFLRDIADVAACRGPGVPQVDPGDMDETAACGQKPAQHAEGGGFAGAIWPQQAKNLAAPDGKRDMVHGDEIAEIRAPGPSLR